jgi:hypothetical protein
MRTLSFKEIARLLNLNSHIRIDIDPDVDGEYWSLHEGEHTVQGFSNRFKIIYIQSSATKKDINEAYEEFVGGQTFVIYPPSLDDKQDLHRNLLKEEAAQFKTSDEFLKSPIKEEIEQYTERLKNQTKPDYIKPRFTTHVLKSPSPVKSFLKSQLSSREDKSGKLGVILASAGQGKTYMSRHIVGEIASNRHTSIVPILVDSSQWNRMAMEDQTSLWKTIAHSFKYFDAPISWIQGNEFQFLESTLKADIFRIVFDGFDEYILRNKGVVKPLEVLSKLNNLAKETNTRIVITSRTSFFKEGISQDFEDFVDKNDLELFEIKPFDKPKAQNYFEKNIDKEEASDRALNIYRSIRGQDEKFVGKGFVISLIADAAKSGRGAASSGLTADNRFDALMWLMKTLCRRETRRQELVLDEENQLSVLQSISYERSKGSKVDNDTFDLLVMEERPNISDRDLESTRDKVTSHPVLRQVQGEDTASWEFEQIQVELALLAKHIIEMDDRRLQREAGKLRIDPKNVLDLSSFLVDLAQGKSTSRDDSIDRLSRLISNLSGSSVYGLQSQLALSSVDEFIPQGRPTEDRTDMLMRLTGNEKVSEIRFLGSTIRSFDFRGTEFRNCDFQEVTFANCKFNNKTKFIRCRFVGGVPPKNCEGFGRSKFSESTFNKLSKIWVYTEMVHEGKKEYSKDHLRREFEAILDKFTEKGSDVLKSSSRNEINKGVLSSSSHKKEILEVLSDSVIKFENSNAEISDNAREDVHFYAMNNAFRGSVRESFEKALKGLGLS